MASKIELFDAYDINENKLDIDLVRGENHPPHLYHLVVEVYTINENNEVLITQRHKDKSYPLMWEVTGGSVLKGESLVDGAKRELEEETGIKVNTNNLHLFYKSISGDSLYRGFVTFINLKDHVVTLQDSETIDYKWIPVSNFENLINSNIFVDRIKDRFMPNKDKFFQLISNKKE